MRGEMTDQGVDQRAPSILYQDWKDPIQQAQDVDQLLKLVRAYMNCWKPEDLRSLPWDLASLAVANTEAIVARAVIASRFELKFVGREPEYKLLRELSLTFAAAANRLRYLQSSSPYLTDSTFFQGRPE